MAKKTKPKKERAKEYDKKLSVRGSFIDLVKLSVNYNPKKAKKKAE